MMDFAAAASAAAPWAIAGALLFAGASMLYLAKSIDRATGVTVCGITVNSYFGHTCTLNKGHVGCCAHQPVAQKLDPRDGARFSKVT